MKLKRKHLRIVGVAAAITALLAFVGSTQASAVNADDARAKAVAYATYPLKPNSVGSSQLTDNGIGKPDLGPVLRNEIFNGIASAQNKANAAATDAKRANDRLDALPQAPGYLDGWGEIFRNTIGNGSSELGQSSAGEGLKVNTPAGTDQTTFGNEADYAGKPVSFSAIKYTVFTTGENIAKSASGNMPSIKFEITNPAGSATYTTLVYAPGNSAANEWATIDAKGDTEKHWGFTGAYFNGAEVNERCGMNGTRCTYAEAIAVLGENAKLMSVAVGKGRDFEFHGAVRDLTLGGDTFKFTENGVTK